MHRPTHVPSPRPRGPLLLLAVALLGAGYAGYRLAAGEEGGRRESPPAPAAERAGSAELVALVEAERAARHRLEAEVDRLRERLDVLAESLPRQVSPGQDPDEGAVEESEVAPSEALADEQRRWFDEAALREAGFRADEAAELLRRRQQIQMENLALFDRAAREGWLGEDRFEAEAASLRRRFGEIRRELGDEGFDWFLYASHRPNRVRITGVFPGSTAWEAGLREGDLVLQYGGKRVFDGGHLVRETASGRAGESVRVEVEREGERRSFYVDRGPLGVRTDGVVRSPSRPR